MTPIYAEVAKLLAQHAPMIPVANGGSATAYKAKVENPQASPLTSERFAVSGVPGQDQFIFIQNGEPSGLWCADETDGEALRVCEQIGESLLAYKINGTEVEPALAESYDAQRRPEGVDLQAPQRREVPGRQRARRQRRRAHLPGPVGRQGPGPQGSRTATSPTSRPCSAAS